MYSVAMASGSSVCNMGNLEIYHPGEYAICDKCDKPKPLIDSYSVMVDGQAVIWLCKECK